ncbi:MAG: hypothetical protein AAGG09_21310 [Pseudomonadota bacterium]
MRPTRSALLGIAMAALTLHPAAAQQRLTEPVAVPVDFLGWVGLTEADLAPRLADLGAPASFRISYDLLETADPRTLKAVNRIRMFAHLSAKGLRAPVFDLPLADGSRCLTQFPRTIVPDLAFQDYARDDLPFGGAEASFLSACRATDPGAYAGLGRAAFRDRYFDARGGLRQDFRELAADPDFLAAAIDLGFFLAPAGYSATLVLQ